jgi:alkylation response protein AidB-like acyl-CoA dehydrogenase
MIDIVVWTNSWPSIVGTGCSLICVSAGEEQARKVYALRGLRGVERQIGSAGGTRWPAGSSAGRMVTRKARRSRGQELVHGSDSQPESARRVCGGSP